MGDIWGRRADVIDQQVTLVVIKGDNEQRYFGELFMLAIFKSHPGGGRVGLAARGGGGRARRYFGRGLQTTRKTVASSYHLQTPSHHGGHLSAPGFRVYLVLCKYAAKSGEDYWPDWLTCCHDVWRVRRACLRAI